MEEESDFEQKAETVRTPAFSIAKQKADAEAKEEEKRLFYVAMTRAKDFALLVGKESSGKSSWLEMIKVASKQGKLEQWLLNGTKLNNGKSWKAPSSIISLPRFCLGRQCL